MDLEPLIKPRRKALVLAAENAIREASRKLPGKSQLSRLISICGEATCTEEIVGYLRYQASRRKPPWQREFAELVIAKIAAPLQDLASDMRALAEPERDRARVAAWRLYAMFLARTLTYTMAAGHEDGDDGARR